MTAIMAIGVEMKKIIIIINLFIIIFVLGNTTLYVLVLHLIKLPGIFGGAPLSPYPISEGMTNFLFSPTHILKRRWQ